MNFRNTEILRKSQELSGQNYALPKKLNKNKDWVRLAAGPKIKKKPPNEDTL